MAKRTFLIKFTGMITKAGCVGCSKVRLRSHVQGMVWDSRDEGEPDNKHLKTEDEINQALRLGEFIKQGQYFVKIVFR